MSHRQKISGILITFAFLLTFLHGTIPHHHHDGMICFSISCEEARHHHECACGHLHHGESDCNCACHSHPSHQHDEDECACGHLHHGESDCNCACHSHPSHQHDEDNCVLSLPYVLPDQTDICAQLNSDYSSYYQYLTFVIPTEWVLPSPTEAAEFSFFAPDEGLPDSPWDNCFLLRGPPAC